MSYVKEKEEILVKKIIPQDKKEDFAEFWKQAVAELRAVPLEVVRQKIKTPYDKTFTTCEISYNTHDATMVKAYFSYPNNADKKLPCVVQFHGGSGQKAIFADILATGVCCLSIDVRSQGGETQDRAVYNIGSVNGGLMTCGITDKNKFYMRNIYLDAIRAVDVAASFDEVDPENIFTFGGSQGGALSIVAASLSGKVKKCYTFLTSYCCLHKRLELGSGIFGSANSFLKNYPEYTDTVWDNFTYFDMNNMVSLLKTPTLFCLGLADNICLPEFVYSAYSHAECPKELMMVPFTPHYCTPKPFKERVYTEFAAL